MALGTESDRRELEEEFWKQVDVFLAAMRELFAELEALGWVVDTEFGSAADGYMAFFNMGDMSLTLTLTETPSGTSIVAMMDY